MSEWPRRLPIELDGDEVKLVLQAFAMSGQEFVEGSLGYEIKEREKVEAKFRLAQVAFQKMDVARKAVADVNSKG